MTCSRGNGKRSEMTAVAVLVSDRQFTGSVRVHDNAKSARPSAPRDLQDTPTLTVGRDVASWTYRRRGRHAFCNATSSSSASHQFASSSRQLRALVLSSSRRTQKPDRHATTKANRPAFTSGHPPAAWIAASMRIAVVRHGAITAACVPAHVAIRSSPGGKPADRIPRRARQRLALRWSAGKLALLSGWKRCPPAADLDIVRLALATLARCTIARRMLRVIKCAVAHPGNTRAREQQRKCERGPCDTTGAIPCRMLNEP